MTRFEKVMNIVFKVYGAIYLLNFVLYLSNIYQPSKTSTAINMLIIGLFALIFRYSFNNNKNKKEEINNE